MEPVKDQGQLLRGDGPPIIADGYISLSGTFTNQDAQISALRAELYGVVQQIVDHLGDVVLLGHGVDRAFRQLHLHLQQHLQQQIQHLHQHLEQQQNQNLHQHLHLHQQLQQKQQLQREKILDKDKVQLKDQNLF